ncbi:MAG: hypothetical protein IPL61_09020 [Myxococcales bacterium]|nr:hypothetical protein [Myxococcales bacterium]
MIGKALKKYPSVRLHAYEVQVNHLHMAYSGTEGDQLALFRNYVHSNIARQINKLRGRRGPFWSRRGRPIAIVDDEAIIARLRYLMAQGPEAGLVASPIEWPGASSTRALVSDMVVEARYTSLDVLTRNARRVNPRPIEALAECVDIELAPIRPWAHLSSEQLRAKHLEMLRSIEAEHEGADVKGAEAVCRVSTTRRARGFRPTPAPPCHASSVESRARYVESYRSFRSTFVAAAARVRERGDASTDDVLTAFPLGAMPRPRWYVRPPASFRPPWTDRLAPGRCDARPRDRTPSPAVRSVLLSHRHAADHDRTA